MEGAPERTLAARTRVLRYAAALALVVAGAVWLLARGGRVCREEVPAQGVSPVEVCAPPAVTDTATVAVLAVVVLLLAPDLGEAGVGGVTVKRAVQEAKTDAATARADVAAVRLALTRLHQEVDVTTSAQATTVVQTGESAVLETLARLGLLRGVAPPATPPTVADTARALDLTEGVERARALLPEAWRAGTFAGVVGEVTLLGGADIAPALITRLLTDPDGAVARAQSGQYAVSPRARGRPVVVAAPVWGRTGEQVGVVAVVLPDAIDVRSDQAAVDLAAAAAVFSSVVAYVRSGGVAGPSPEEEAP